MPENAPSVPCLLAPQLSNMTMSQTAPAAYSTLASQPMPDLQAEEVPEQHFLHRLYAQAVQALTAERADTADVDKVGLPALPLEGAAAAAAETVHRPVHTTTALPGGSSPALVAPPPQQAQQQPLLHGLGFATFTSSAQRQKRWIAHAVMLCHPRAQASRFQAVYSGPQDAGGAAGSSALEAGELGEASHEAGSASADQHRQAAELEQKACTAKLYSFMSFQAAPLRSASNAGFRKVPWTQFGLQLKEVASNDVEPGKGVIAYEQLGSVEDSRTQSRLEVCALHIFNEAEVPRPSPENSQEADGRQAAGQDSVDLPTPQAAKKLGRQSKEIRVPALSQRSEQKLVATAIHKALQNLKMHGDGMFGLNKAEVRTSLAIPCLASSLSSIITHASSPLLPFTCRLLACDANNIHAALHNQICALAAKEIHHAGPSLTDVNPIAARMHGGGAANQPGRAHPVAQEQSPGLAPPEATTDDQVLPDTRPWPAAEQSCLDDTSEAQQHCNTLLVPRPQPSKRTRSSQPCIPACEGSVTHSWQEPPAAMHPSPGCCQHDFDPASDEVGPATGGKGLCPDPLQAFMPQPQHQAASSTAFHCHRILRTCSPNPSQMQHPLNAQDGLLQRAQQLYNVRPLKKPAVQPLESADDDWLL